MAAYSIQFRRSVEKDIDGIPKRDLRRIISRIRKLARDPRPAGCEKLSAQERYRVRQGNYRVVYGVDDLARTVTVAKIGHRRDVYRD